MTLYYPTSTEIMTVISTEEITCDWPETLIFTVGDIRNYDNVSHPVMPFEKLRESQSLLRHPKIIEVCHRKSQRRIFEYCLGGLI